MKESLRRAFRYALNAVVILAALLFFVSLWGMSGSHTYHRQALVYLEGVQDVLISHGLCQDRNDCVKKQILFGDGGAFRVGPYESGGVQISVYEVSRPEVVGDLVKACVEIYKTQKGPPLSVQVYESRHHESKTRFASFRIE